jgi:CheY-like chemotaxis protein
MARCALVVDDDPIGLETVVSMLEELGCETIPVRSGSEALGQLAARLRNHWDDFPTGTVEPPSDVGSTII